MSQVLHGFATEGAHCSKVREILDASEVSCDIETLSIKSLSTSVVFDEQNSQMNVTGVECI